MRRAAPVTLLAAAALVFAACVPLGPPPPPPVPPPAWVPSGTIATAPAAAACKSILLIGDSVLVETEPQLAALYTANGYCVTLDQEAINGSSPSSANDGTGDSWTTKLAGLLAANHYDAVVVDFQGNGTEQNLSGSNSDEILAANETESINIANEVRAAGAALYWANPMLSAYLCQWSASFNTKGYEAYREWVMTTLDTSIPRIDENVLTPQATSSQRGPAGYTDTLLVDTARSVVRDGDCLHLQNDGPYIAAYEIVYTTTNGLWPQATAASPRPLPQPVPEHVTVTTP